MGTKRKAAPAKVVTLDRSAAALQAASGSTSTDFQSELINKVTAAPCLPERKTDDQRMQTVRAAYEALQRTAPGSELERMLAAQMTSTHNAAVECLRRAMNEGQTFEGDNQNLIHAPKLLGIYERQLAAPDKHRGNGQQKNTVEHVTVEAGSQAIVGTVQAAPTPAQSKDVVPPALTDHRRSESLSASRLGAVPEKAGASARKPRRS